MLKDELAAWKNYILTQRWEDRNMHINLTALIHLVTRATNRVPAGSDTGYPNGASEPIGSALDSSIPNRPRDDTKMCSLRAGPIGWLAAVPTHSIIPHYPQPHHGLVAHNL